MKHFITVACMTLGLALTGCNSGGSSGGGNNNDDNNNTSQNPNVDMIFTATTNDEAESLNVSELETELARVFGGANDTPITVELGDTITDVLDRTGY